MYVIKKISSRHYHAHISRVVINEDLNAASLVLESPAMSLEKERELEQLSLTPP